MSSNQALSSICAEGGGDIQTGPFGSQLHASDYVPEGVPAVMPKNIRVEAIDTSDIAKITERDAKRLSKYRLATGDIVYSRRGDVEKCTIISEKENGWLCGTGCLRVRVGKSKYSPEFIHAYLSSAPVRAYISQRAVGATMPNLNTSILGAIPIPDFPDHRIETVGKNWATINHKLLLNQRMDTTLEDMAQAIFRCWFVDFEPTRAKMAQKEGSGESEASICNRLKITPDILALFPDTMEESDYGPKPLGWRLSTIEQEVDIFGGSTPSTKNSTFWDDGTLCWSTPKDLSNSLSPVLLDTERKITEAGVMTITSGQLPKGTLLMSSRAPVGYLAIAEVPISVNQGYIAMVCEKTLSNLYMLFWAKKNMDQIKDRANGSTFQEISKKNFRPISVLVPGSQLLSEFEKACRPLYTQIVLNMRQAQTLAQIRDALLPKLLSGEISVGVAAAAAQEV